MASFTINHYKVVRNVTTLSIIALIVVSVYYLNATLEMLKKMIDSIEHADAVMARQSSRNISIAKMIIEPMQRSAHDMYHRHEPSIIMNIISYSMLIVFSFSGLIVVIRKNPIFMVVYGMCLDLIYTSSFFYASRLKPSICAFVVFVSIMTYMHARQLYRAQNSKNVRIVSTTSCTKNASPLEYKPQANVVETV